MDKKLNLFIALFICLLLAGYMLFRSQWVESEPTTPARTTSSSIIEMPSNAQKKEDDANSSQSTESKQEDETENKIHILDEILASKNDNDPRLDQVFTKLNPQTKSALENKYFVERKENLNERGTIVLLLGMNITSLNDLLFFKQVTQQAPCQSLLNCETSARSLEPEHRGEDAVTLAYPQIVALTSLETFIHSQKSNTSLKTSALNIIEEASKSNHEEIQFFASEIMKNISND